MASHFEKDEVQAPFLPSHRIREDQDIEESQVRPRNQSSWIWQASALSVMSGVIFASLLWLSAWAIYLNHDNTTPCASTALPNKTNCGSNPATAKANGCSFQLWSYSWVPPECFDKELQTDFLALRDEEDWHYYTDTETPWAQVPLESVLAGDRNDLHSTWGQHFWHCAFYQRKFFRIVEEQDGERTPMLKMTNRDLDAEHSMHCQKWLANPSLYPWDEVRINLTVGYHECS